MKKNSFLMLLALIFFLGCSPEILNNSESQVSNNFTKENVKTRILNKNDFENAEFLKVNVSEISTFLLENLNKSSSSNPSQVGNGYEIYTNTFEEVSYLDTKYYSFYIISDESDGYEEKIILKSVNNRVLEKYILKYKRKSDFSIDPNSYQTLKLSDSPNMNSKTMYVDTFTMGCSTYVVTSYECGYTGHHTNGQYCSVLGVNMPNNTVSVTFDPSCMSGGGGGTQTGGGSSGGGGGGGVPGSTTPPIITIPTSAPLYVVHGPKGKTCNSLGLDPTEIDQINNDQSLRLKIYQYIASSGSGYPLPCDNTFFFDEYKTFIKALIKYVTDTNTSANDLTFEYLNSLYKFFQEEYIDINEPLEIFHRLKALDNALVQNTNLLLDIPCDQLPFWQSVATHQVPQSVKTKLENIKNQTSWWSNWKITDLDDGASARVNMDLFPIKINSLPNKPNSTQKYTPEEFFNFFRLNINLFAEKFTPIVDGSYGIDDTALWNSSNPLGSLIHIEIPLDDGTVVCSGVSTNAWVFSTIKAPMGMAYDGIHPVSGNRFFSYYMEGDTMYIYTRGVDRVSKKATDSPNLANYLIESSAFFGADQLWKGMQDKLSAYINQRGGSAAKMPEKTYRPNYEKVRNYLKGNIPLSSLGC